LQVIQDAVNDGTYSTAEAEAARAKALADDFDTQEPEPRLVYQLPATYTRAVQLVDDHGTTQQVSLRLSYFVSVNQPEDLDFTRSLLPLYYPHLAAALVRLMPVWLNDESAFFFVNKVDAWEDGQPSTAVELIRLL
jgi:hypothetical protein